MTSTKLSGPLAPLSADILGTLTRFDTPTICNVIELFDIRPRSEGFMNSSIKCMFPEMKPVCGYATTATFRSAEPPKEGEAVCPVPEQIGRIAAEVPAPRIVVFQDLDEPVCGATFGECMCSMYQATGCEALITSGAARDLEQVRAIGFQTFASAVVASHGYCRPSEVNVPITVGGLKVMPGDLIHCDANGITNIPLEIAEEVAKACDDFVATETVLLDYCHGTNAAATTTVEGIQDACRKKGEMHMKLEERCLAFAATLRGDESKKRPHAEVY